MSRYWWVNQNQTYWAEISGGYMWSPKTNKNGGFNRFYENMTEVRSGDLVFSFADRLIKAVGVVLAPARSAEKPGEFGKAGDAWNADGWLVQVDYDELRSPPKPKDHMDVLAPLLPEKYSPIRADGDGNQVYLAEISASMAEALLSLAGRQSDAPVAEGHAREIQGRTDIGPTEKVQLVLSRIGQGKFRKNVEKQEAGCRITGVVDGRFLTASHIKPWAKGNDLEKLDGYNGLLLSPHVDRLFDRGYISFRDNGELILGSDLPHEVIVAWGLTNRIDPNPLKPKQRVYMDYHRRKIFEKR